MTITLFFSQIIVVLFSLPVFLCGSLQASVENDSPSLLIGQSCALSGPAKNLGLKMRAGLQAAIAEINDAGGVKGKTLYLRSKDDGYEPDRAIKNTLELLQDDQVFMLIGEVGTPTSKAVLPIIEQHKVPFFAPLTGAEFLREPYNPHIINIRASYYQEMEALTSYLTEVLHLQNISCFYQNDSYGFAGLEGIKLALQKRDLHLMSIGSYERNTVAVMGGLREIYRETPEAVILVGTYPACSEFIKLSKAKYPGKRIYCNISFVGTDSLKDALGQYGEDVIVSQVVPFPWDNTIPLVREYQQAMLKYQRNYQFGFTSLEGYIAAKLFASIAELIPGKLTREKFLLTIQKTANFNLGGVIFHLGDKSRQNMKSIELSTIFPIIKKLKPDE